MARTEIVIGGTALSASLAAGTNLVQLEELGGSQMFTSGSYLTGFQSGSNTPSQIQTAPEDSRVFRLTWED